MDPAPCISQIATLLAEPKRAAMLWALMDGSAKPVEILAEFADVSPASAKAQLNRLAASGLVRVERRGQQQLFRLAAPDVGAALDALASTAVACRVRSGCGPSPSLVTPEVLRHARVCRGHMGGELAAGIYQRMLATGWIERVERRVEVTLKGTRKLAALGIFTQALALPVASDCCDWSEQQPHLGGALGAALLQLFLQAGWASVVTESHALHISTNGGEEIAQLAAA